MEKLLQGRPMKHPLHPFLVRFPIAMFTLSLMLDVLYLISPDLVGTPQGAWYTMMAGVGTAFLAAIPGVADYTSIRRDHSSRGKATTHMVLNLAVVVLYVVNLTIRYNEALHNEPSTLPLVLSFVAFGMLAFSGHLGGRLIFDDGGAVGRHRRHTDLPKKTFKPGKDADAGDGYVKIARDRDLDDGETIRAEVYGTVIVLARVDGQVHAFQEFCTHRFGPLSEGCIHKGEVECPWHRSRFDIRTGEVTSGPAKEGLRTFRTKIQDEMIAVAVD